MFQNVKKISWDHLQQTWIPRLQNTYFCLKSTVHRKLGFLKCILDVFLTLLVAQYLRMANIILLLLAMEIPSKIWISPTLKACGLASVRTSRTGLTRSGESIPISVLAHFLIRSQFCDNCKHLVGSFASWRILSESSLSTRLRKSFSKFFSSWLVVAMLESVRPYLSRKTITKIILLDSCFHTDIFFVSFANTFFYCWCASFFLYLRLDAASAKAE